MIYYRDRMCYIVLKEGEYMVQIAYTVPTDPKVAEELLHMNVSKAHEQMAELIKTERRRALEIKVYGDDKEIKETVLLIEESDLDDKIASKLKIMRIL